MFPILRKQHDLQKQLKQLGLQLNFLQFKHVMKYFRIYQEKLTPWGISIH